MTKSESVFTKTPPQIGMDQQTEQSSLATVGLLVGWILNIVHSSALKKSVYFLI